jgi:phage shock protein PspC (stress-responsive transcriptional regulator)
MSETVAYRELRRSRSDRMLGGVCGGLGAYFNVNPAFYRVGFVLLALLGGAGLVIYGACLLVIPIEGEQDSIATEALRNHRRRPAALVGLVLVAIAGIALLSHVNFRLDNDLWWIAVLVVGAAILWSQRPREVAPAAPVAMTAFSAGPGGEAATAVAVPPPPPPPAAPPRGPSPFLLALGGLVAAGGVLGLLAAAGVDIPWAVALGVAAIAVGIGVVAGAVNRKRVGALAVLGILLAIAAIVAGSVNLHLDDGVGDHTYRPTSTAALRPDYRLGIGSLQLDLSDLEVEPGLTRITAHVGIGELDVITPKGVAVHVVAHVNWGDTNVFGRERDGHDTTNEVGPDDAPLELDLHVGAGQIEVSRAVR